MDEYDDEIETVDVAIEDIDRMSELWLKVLTLGSVFQPDAVGEMKSIQDLLIMDAISLASRGMVSH